MKKSIFVLLLVAGLILASCNAPNGSPSQSDMMTAAAMTIQAILTPPLNSPTVPVPATPVIASQAPISPSVTSAQTGTPTPTQTITPTITPTYSLPMLTIKESTFCRNGPGQSYAIIFAFLPGATTEIVGQYPTDNYWIVKLPDSNDTCWIWGEYATATGSYWIVPTATIPPTATASPPEVPVIINWSYDCANASVDIKWSDRSEGEEGYRVLRDGTVVAELPPNSTSFSEVFAGTATGKITYQIEVFTGKLTAQSGTISFSCQ